MELEQSMITASLAKRDRLEIVNEVQEENKQQQEFHEAENVMWYNSFKWL